MDNDDIFYKKSAGRPAIDHPDSRTLLALYKIYTRKQLAEQYHASIPTVSKWIAKARKELQGNLKA